MPTKSKPQSNLGMYDLIANLEEDAALISYEEIPNKSTVDLWKEKGNGQILKINED